MKGIERARLSLAGLSVGDALGERYFGPPDEALERIARRELPPPPWRYTDDTEMALSLVEVLERQGRVVPHSLAHSFANRYDPHRGYGSAAHELLQDFRRGVPWTHAFTLFGGGGSYGNGAAMRVAPVGAYFADDLQAVVENAALSALVTHTHREGVAGTVAVAVAAAHAWIVGEGEVLNVEDFLRRVADRTPSSETRDGIEDAAGMAMASPVEVAEQLGSGQRISAQDTVPFALWCAAHHLDSYEEAFWATVSGLGDRDTTCAIVGGVVALSDRRGPPAAWLEAREPLP